MGVPKRFRCAALSYKFIAQSEQKLQRPCNRTFRQRRFLGRPSTMRVVKWIRFLLRLDPCGFPRLSYRPPRRPILRTAVCLSSSPKIDNAVFRLSSSSSYIDSSWTTHSGGAAASGQDNPPAFVKGQLLVPALLFVEFLRVVAESHAFKRRYGSSSLNRSAGSGRQAPRAAFPSEDRAAAARTACVPWGARERSRFPGSKAPLAPCARCSCRILAWLRSRRARLAPLEVRTLRGGSPFQETLRFSVEITGPPVS